MKAWKNYLAKTLRERDTEEGFSLTELMIGVVVIGILAAIAVPVWTNMQNEMNSQQIKTQLQQAAMLLETEALDNNGLYPTYIPNEVLQMTKGSSTSNEFNLKRVIYTYSADRVHWCMQTDSPLGKLFVSDQSKEATGEVCTQALVGSNSQTPWDVPNVPTPTLRTFTNTWSATSTHAIATLVINPVQCDLLGDDSEEWGSNFRVEYSVRVTNNSRTSPVVNPTSWSTNTNISVNLSGWLPEDQIRADVRARCVTDFGSGYAYPGDYSAKVAGQVAWFNVNNVSWTTTPSVTWGTNAQPRYSAAWTATAFCPSGTPHYALAVSGTRHSNGSTGTLLQVGTSTGTPTTWAGGYNGDLPADTRGGEAVSSVHKVVCELSDGRLRASSGITHNIAATPIKAPTAVPAITSNNAAGSTSVYPNRIAWSGGGTCQVGTLQYRVVRTAPTSATILNWGTATTSNQTHTAGTNYTYTVEARCADGSVLSAVRGTGTTTFKAEWNIPPAPSAVSTFANNGSGTLDIKNDRLTWGAVTCPSSTPEYQVRQMVKGGTTIATASRPASAWLTTTYHNLPSSWIAPGNTVQFEVAARCTGPGGSSASTAYATSTTGARWTTKIDAPSAPRSVSVVRTGATTWTAPATVCEPGATLEYLVHNVTSKVDGTWGTSRSVTAPSWENIGGNSYNITVRARCGGANADSAASATTAASVSIPYKTAWTTAHGDNCSNYRSGPSTSAGVVGCYDQWGGTNETLYNYCVANGYTWFRTPRGWTVAGNLENATSATVRNQC